METLQVCGRSGLGLGVAHEGRAQLAQQVGTAQALIDRRGKNGLLDDGGARDEGLLAHAASTGLECALRSHGQRGQDQHLCDVDRLIQLGRGDLAGIPIEQPHVGGGVDDDGLRGESTVRNAARVREVQLFPRAVQDLVRRVLAELRQRSCWGQRGHDHDD